MGQVALIVGAGGVLGAALGAEFSAAGYAVAGLRRPGANPPANPTDGAAMELETCDLQDASDVQAAADRVVRRHGAVDVLVHNAAHLTVAPFLSLTNADLETAWRSGVACAAAGARAVLPAMLQQGRGAMIFTGATAALRGGARFAAFASAKFALRGFAQSLAREFQPHGIHVAHVVLDGLLAGSPSAKRFGTPDSPVIEPGDVARAYRLLAEQPRSTWTHEVDLRPSEEKF
ncbi:MAG TPA: SDR family NAD(P)-dependent oxidoreductase [bacterium]